MPRKKEWEYAESLPLLNNLEPKYEKILNDALYESMRIHAFSSGGGLRVVRIERNNILKGYGEDPQIEDALRMAARNLTHKKQQDSAYMTGTTELSSRLDWWVRFGNPFDAYVVEGGKVVFEFHGFGEYDAGPEVMSKVIDLGEVVTTQHRGFTYEHSRSYFPGNGEPCMTTRTTRCPPGKSEHRAWMWRMVKRGFGKTFSEAAAAAWTAEEIEKEDE